MTLRSTHRHTASASSSRRPSAARQRRGTVCRVLTGRVMPGWILFRRILLGGVLLGGVLLGWGMMPLEIAFSQPPGESPPNESPQDDSPTYSPAGSETAVNAILSRAGRNPVAKAAGLNSLVRLGRLREANALIRSIDVGQLSPPELAAMDLQIGTAARLRLFSSDEIELQSRQILSAIAAAGNAERTDPASLANALAVVADSGAQTRQSGDAIRTLVAGGQSALAAIANHLVASPPAPSDTTLLKVLLQIDPLGGDSLRPFAHYGSADNAVRAAGLLARLDSDRYAPAIAAAALRTRSATLSDADLDRLTTYFHALRKQAKEALNDGSTEDLWILNPDTQTVSVQRSDRLQVLYRQCVDVGSGFLPALPIGSPVADEIMVADLSYRVLIDFDWGDDDQMQSFLMAHPQAGNARQLATLYDTAAKWDDHPAMLGIVRLATAGGNRKPPESDPSTTASPEVPVIADASRTEMLVTASQCGVPRIRYEAALAAAASVPPGDSFAGQTFVAQTLSEAVRLSDLPIAVLLENRPEIIQVLQPMLTDAGYQVEITSTVQQTLDRLSAGGDIRFVLSKIQLKDLPPIELVDRTRRRSQTRHLPIVFFNEPNIDDEIGIYRQSDEIAAVLPAIAEKRGDGITEQIDFPKSMLALRPMLTAAEHQSRLPPMVAIDRRLYASDAADRLAALVGD